MSVIILSIPFWVVAYFWGKYARLNSYNIPQHLIGLFIIIYFQIRAFQVAGIWG